MQPGNPDSARMERVNGYLMLVKEYPSLTDPIGPRVGAIEDGELIVDRCLQDRDCPVCGETSLTHMIAQTSDGRRWVDLCHPCYAALLELQAQRQTGGA